MQATTKQNLLLLFAAVLLATILFSIKNKSEQNKETRLPIKVSALNKILIKHKSEIILEKRDDSWYMTSPKQGQVKPERIEKMLKYLMLPLEGGFLTKDYSLYSLDTPRMIVTLNNEPLKFGSLNTMQQMHYIMFRNEIYLARPFLQISFDKPVDDLLIISPSER